MSAVLLRFAAGSAVAGVLVAWVSFRRRWDFEIDETYDEPRCLR